MPNFALDTHAYAVWLAAYGLSILAMMAGIAGLVWPRLRWGTWAGCGLFLLLAVFLVDALAWSGSRWPETIERFGLQLAIALGVAAVFVLVLRGSPLRASLALLACGLALAGWLTWRVEQPVSGEIIAADEMNLEQLNLARRVDADRMIEVNYIRAVTDRGTPIPVYNYRERPKTGPIYSKTLLNTPKFANQTIQTGPPVEQYNCHGWTFAGGVYHILGKDVEPILRDNGYESVEKPQVDDVVIYRSPEGEVVHSGVVKAIGANGFVLIESKWGFLGRYLHEPAIQCYSSNLTYYRSPRQGHLLRGLSPAETPTTVSLGL